MVSPDAQIVTAAPGTRHRAEDLRPAVILLDRDAAAGRGWALIPDLRPRGPPRLLVMSAAAAPAAIAQALDQGADDYLCKPFSHLELLARLKALRRRPPVPPAIPAAVVQIGAVGVAGAHGDIRGAGEPRARTPTA
jgi:DNA-binding response OmpR family regulator